MPTVPEPAAAPPAAAPSPERPFLIERRRLDETPAGYHRPAARLVLTPALRTAGLWHALPGEEWKTLLLVLTFLTPNGDVRPAVAELAAAMGVPEGRARPRLARLAALSWRGEPLLRELPRESGLDAVTPAPALLAFADAPPQFRDAPPAPPPPVAGREAVVAYSRAHYARPRAEVEAEIARFYGWDVQAQGEQAERLREREAALPPARRGLLGQLVRRGVDREQALALVTERAPEAVQRQLDWLPYRQAKSPARFLVAAIAGDYGPPPALRRLPPEAGPGPAAPWEPEAPAEPEAPTKPEAPTGRGEDGGEADPLPQGAPAPKERPPFDPALPEGPPPGGPARDPGEGG